MRKSQFIAAIAAVVLASASTLTKSAYAESECELTCGAECKQEVSLCNSAAKTQAKFRKFDCNAAFSQGQVECEFEAVEVMDDCLGLCGPDLSECKSEAKSVLTECKTSVKEDNVACKAEASARSAADREECQELASDCFAGCSE